jgi:hypothetical protein
MSTGFPFIYVVPGDELRSREQAMAENFARHGGDPSRVNFRQAAASVEIMALREALGALGRPCRMMPWIFTDEGAVEVVTVFESEADRELFRTQYILSGHGHRVRA